MGGLGDAFTFPILPNDEWAIQYFVCMRPIAGSYGLAKVSREEPMYEFELMRIVQSQRMRGAIHRRIATRLAIAGPVCFDGGWL